MAQSEHPTFKAGNFITLKHFSVLSAFESLWPAIIDNVFFFSFKCTTKGRGHISLDLAIKVKPQGRIKRLTFKNKWLTKSQYPAAVRINIIGDKMLSHWCISIQLALYLPAEIPCLIPRNLYLCIWGCNWVGWELNRTISTVLSSIYLSLNVICIIAKSQFIWDLSKCAQQRSLFGRL